MMEQEEVLMCGLDGLGIPLPPDPIAELVDTVQRQFHAFGGEIFCPHPSHAAFRWPSGEWFMTEFLDWIDEHKNCVP